jgi:UDP-galactopyranose mutase
MIVKIIGAGLAGCTCARLLADKGVKVLLFEKRSHIGGLLYDKDNDDIFQHYGPHIFHTSNPEVIQFVLRFAKWRAFCNRPLAVTDKGLARLPISIETIADINNERLDVGIKNDKNKIEKYIIEKYSKKQWGPKWNNKDAINRLKVSKTIGGSYFDDVFEGLPSNGFFQFLEKMVEHDNIEIHLSKKVNDIENKEDVVIWTAPIDECPKIKIKLNWNGTRFERIKDNKKYLSAVYNYNIDEVPYTRTTKMKLLVGCKSEDVLAERPRASSEKHYIIINDSEKKRVEKAIKRLETKNWYFCGRAGTASYLDMDEVIENAFEITEKIINKH